MITSGAIIHGDINYLLGFNNEEHPIAVQLGGSKPKDLALAAKHCKRAGYDEINLNVGCPSERVKSGAFGACLMNEPLIVANCIEAMRDAVDIPVTIKCRIGVDENDSYEALCHFVEINNSAGCDAFIIHARKAWLSGLSPKQNREIPPLNYPRVFALKRDYPNVPIILNGGIKTIEGCKSSLDQLDGVMVGREAYQNPYFLHALDNEIFDSNTNIPSRMDIANQYALYIEKQLSKGVRLNHMTRHMLGLFNGVPRAKQWRRYISENASKPKAGIDTYLNSLKVFDTPVKAKENR